MSRLYDTDFVAWSEQQAALLSRLAAGERVNSDDLDWLNIAEEIDALGKNQRRELGSRILNILVHLMKLTMSPAAAPRKGWAETILEQRDELERLLADAPSLVRTIPDVIRDEMARARKRTRESLSDYSEQVDLDNLTFTQEQVFGGLVAGAAHRAVVRSI